MVDALSPAVRGIVEHYLASGGYSSADEILLDALTALCERDEDAAAIADGIAATEAGDTIPLEGAVDEIRSRHGFSAKR